MVVLRVRAVHAQATIERMPLTAPLSCGVQVRNDLKPASMATVEAEFEKQPQRSDWQATRVSRWVAAEC